MRSFLVVLTLLIAWPAAAQMDHHHHHMPTGDVPSQEDVPSRPADDVGDADEPPIPSDHAADRIFDPSLMAVARVHSRHEHDAGDIFTVLIDRAEYRSMNGHDGYHWDAEAWYGGDINRLLLKTKGEGTWRRDIESSQLQVLYSRAIDPYFDLHAGIRQDFAPGPARTYATIGVEGLAPFFIETEGALFLSTKGDLLATLEVHYQQLVTQRLVLEPRLELSFAAQDVPRNEVAAGLSAFEAGVRLRYDIQREIAPYIGVFYERKVGAAAGYARAAGHDVEGTSLVIGISTWF